MPEQYCPDCVTKLVRQSKQLGNLSVWMVCPDCGYRERPVHEGQGLDKTARYLKEIKSRNTNQFNRDIWTET